MRSPYDAGKPVSGALPSPPDSSTTIDTGDRDALAPGSHLTLTHATLDFATAPEAAFARDLQARGRTDLYTRDHEQIAAFFTGLHLLAPGIVPVTDGQPAAGERPSAHDVAIYGGVGRLD
ncbi:SAM-dependent methyltransferase [Actinoplanes awajinensis]|uniref:Uncharacterized protein n=1 Tax=Actinoplanes awajinensis subsp. mycoplanecinus TaxID=135947 RepID=A0A101JR10_9ACTN|nr:SAM-dependent methyltransferase [Actinoplanes awajinensis]KUL30846.1 hypothetical protein ADL15_23065 [Actinoplanes awajinensis subsp. mycoplanecinus]